MSRCDERLKTRVESPVNIVVYYKSRKREIETRPMYECRCDERLKTRGEEST